MNKSRRSFWHLPLAAILLLAVFLNASNNGYSQNLALKMTNALPTEALKKLSRQSSDHFDSNSITIDEKLKLPPFKGIVKTAKGVPLKGINITVKGKTTGTTTNDAGEFTINALQTDILIISGIGFKTQTVAIAGKTGLNIVLTEGVMDLEEVVVSGYIAQSKKDFTGSAAHVGAAQIENRPIQSFEQVLAGQAPGVNLIQPNGVLGNTPVLRIRGVNSISLSSYPLIIIDGVAAFTGSFGTKAANNPLSDINPSDIESVDILKDASATAIYGSRASNGVLVLTTKKGKAGRTKVNFDTWIGLSKAVNLPKMLNATQYVAIKNEALANAGQAPAFFLQKRADSSIVETNWYDYGYQTAVSHNYNINFSGANETTNYFVSAGYSDHDGIIRTNSFERKGVKLSLDHKLFKTFNVGMNLTYTNTMNRSPSTGSLPSQSFQIDGVARAVMMLNPNVSPYNEDGSYNMLGGNIGRGANLITNAYYNEVALLDHDYFTSESTTIIGNVYAQWDIFKGLKAKTSYSLNKINTESVSFYSPLQGIGFNNNGLAQNLFSTDYRDDWSNTLTYTKSFGGKHNFSILGGYERIKTTVNQWGAERTNLTDPSFTNYQGGFSIINAVGNVKGQNGLLSYFSNLFYDFNKKYLISASFRRDGYSGLSEGHKYGNFGGGSVGWNLSEEAFYKKLSISNFLSDIKIRGSYGTVGNVNLGNYPALSLYSTSGLYAGLPLLYSSQAGNADLQWETSKKTDIGFDFSLWNNRITVQADYYNNNIDNMVLQAKQAPSRGIPGNSIASNVGSMYNRGIELNIIAHVINHKDFTWTTNFNISTLKNKVTKLADNNADILGNSGSTSGSTELASITRVGYAVGSIFAPRTIGINPDNGQRMYLNRKNETVQYNHVGVSWTYLDGTRAAPIDGVLDGVVLGSALPSYYGGFNNSFTYKNFDVDLSFSFSGGNKIYWGTGATLLDGRYHNNSVKMLERWTTKGQITDVPKIVYSDNTSNGGSVSNSGNVYAGDYAKLRNASIGYRIPPGALARIKISSLRVYVQGTNLLIFTNYPGSDPEVSVNGNDSSAPGADKNSAPSARTVTFGLNVGF